MKKPQIISNNPIVIHPFLFAVFPILFLFSHNVNSVSLNEIIFPLFLVIIITIIIWIGLNFVLKSRIKSGFITSIGLILFFTYGHIYILLNTLQKGVDFSHLFLLIPTLILLGLGVYYFIKTKRSLNNTTKIVNAVSISLIIISFVSVGEYFITSDFSVEVLNEIPEEILIDSANDETFPDVFYIILDAYAGSLTLEKFLNFDNSEFINFLTKKEFYVSEESYSNYRRSDFSISSTLNMRYLDHPAEKTGIYAPAEGELLQTLKHNLVFQYFKSKGYTIFNIEAGYERTKHMKNVDFRLCTTKSLVASDFNMILLRSTIINPIHVELFSGDARDKVLCGFSELVKMSERDDKPKFVFAHLNIPHKPILFGANGEPINPEFLETDDHTKNWDPDLYLGQLKFANKKTREVIEKLTKIDPPPIIIIQSDHGMRGGDFNKSSETFSNDLNNFKAYYFPGKGRNMDFETTTPVNSFRVLLNLYFDEKYELLEDRSYMNTVEKPFTMTDVTEKLIRLDTSKT